MSDLLRVLDEIQARADAATAGPWDIVTDSCDCYGGCGHGENGTPEFLHAIRTPQHEQWNIGDGSGDVCDPDDPTDYLHHQRSEIMQFLIADGEFIASARQDVPRLVAAVRAVLDEHYPNFVGSHCGGCVLPWPCPTVRAVSSALAGGETQ